MKRFFIPFLIFLISSCNRTKNFEDIELLLDKEWHLTSIEQGDIEITNQCNLDDILVFNDASNFNYNFGDLTCYENEENKESIKWKLIDDYTKLRMKYRLNEEGSRSTLIEYWQIVELNDTLLIVQDDYDGGEEPKTKTFVY